MWIQLANKVQYILFSDSKTEFVSVLSELYEREKRIPLNVEFKNNYQFFVKPSVPVDVSILENEDASVKQDTLKEVKKVLQILIKKEDSIFGNQNPTKKNVIPKKETPNKNTPTKETNKNISKNETTSNKSNPMVSPRKKKEITIATFSFEARKFSHFIETLEQPDELTLHPGDVITVLEKNEDGWWVGEVNGKSGLFPGNHCELGSEK
jgi:hypothetical protein